MKTFLLTVILSFSSTAVIASTIQHQGLDWSRGMSVELRADGAVKNASAGVGQLLVDGASYFDSFCVNLFQGISVGVNYSAVSIAALSFDGDGDSAAWLMQQYLPVVNAASGLARQLEGAALQLAIWDTIHDGGDGFAAGRVQSTANTNSSVLAFANQWRLEAIDQTATANVYTPVRGTAAFQQQLYIPPPGGGEVPEPGTLAMVAIGAAAIGFAKFRRA